MDWKQTLATVAPTIATALGGPLAGVATKAIAGMLGVEANEQAIEQAVVDADPSIMLKLKEAENLFIVQMKELDIDLERIHAGDRDSARAMRAKTGSYITEILAAVVIAGFFSVVFYVLTGGKIVDNVLGGTIIGYVSAKADQVISFFFGSSKSSKDKTIAMTKLIK